ncbi:hypothetical protein NQ176_g4803 [Zarea fungicola]|uniref:Uncharacterized protein n=1 Tax=Zarea fungicola TaxID=93591 RepID=A0ACC1NCF2_9HYPO|nr:hypothetical protein NQ176_g4803 [Lecanicillium fungicola]
MRGDLVRILYDATKDRVKYIFGKTVESYEEDEDKVTVHLSDDTTDTFDVLVGADGQGSRVRRSMLPGVDPYRRLGVHGALWIVPRREEDTSFCKMYLVPGGRMVMYRSHSATESHCYVAMRDDGDLSELYRAPIEEQKTFWARKFADAEWQTPRLLEVLKTTDTFYATESVQVSIDTLYKGRVVLVGDAGYCPSSLTGRGTTGAFVGSYILAGEILRHSDDLPTAFSNYNNIMRPFVEDIQKFNPNFIKYAVPQTQWGIKAIHTLTWFICWLRIPQLMARFSSPDVSPWKMPEYPELK